MQASSDNEAPRKRSLDYSTVYISAGFQAMSIHNVGIELKVKVKVQVLKE